MNWSQWFVKYSAKHKTTHQTTNGKVTVTAMSANHAITETFKDIPSEFCNVVITTVHQLE